MARPFRAAYAGAAVITVLGAATGRDRWQWATKPLLMPLLAADAVQAGRATGERGRSQSDRALLLGSLAAATVGDILLIDPDDDRR